MGEGGEQIDRVEWPARELHELNNLLSAIRLSSSFALKSAAADESLANDLRTIADAAERAAELIQALQASSPDPG